MATGNVKDWRTIEQVDRSSCWSKCSTCWVPAAPELYFNPKDFSLNSSKRRENSIFWIHPENSVKLNLIIYSMECTDGLSVSERQSETNRWLPINTVFYLSCFISDVQGPVVCMTLKFENFSLINSCSLYLPLCHELLYPTLLSAHFKCVFCQQWSALPVCLLIQWLWSLSSSPCCCKTTDTSRPGINQLLNYCSPSRHLAFSSAAKWDLNTAGRRRRRTREEGNIEERAAMIRMLQCNLVLYLQSSEDFTLCAYYY